MVKTKKRSVIALIAMAFLLVASIVLAATGAWFTDSDAKNNTITFGDIELDTTAYVQTVTRGDKSTGTGVTSGDKILFGTADGLAEGEIQMVMPGDIIDFNGKIVNKDQKAWVAYRIVITINKADVDFSTLTHAAESFGDAWTVNTDTKGTITATIEAVAAVEAGADVVDFDTNSIDVTISTDFINEELADATGSIAMKVVAVQHANYEAPATAQELFDEYEAM